VTQAKRKSASDRKAEIVRQAIRLADETGPDRVTTQHLADAVGLSQPAIFRHFPNKSDIWLAVGQTITRDMEAWPLDDGGDDAAGCLVGLVTRQFGYITQNPAIPAILFSRELHAGNEKLRQHFERVMAARRAGFAALIRRAQDLGQLRHSLDADDAAALILATIQGLAMRWSLENRSFDLQAEGTRLIRTVIDGFAPPGV
jgi:AcrR family transcriptional regulator